MKSSLFKKQSELDKLNQGLEVKVDKVEEKEVILDKQSFGITKEKDGSYSVVRIRFNNDLDVGSVEKVFTDRSFLLVVSQFKITVAENGVLDEQI